MSDESPEMPSMDKPYQVEVTIDAPRDVVWRALTDPAEIRRWFGWDYPSLDDEIRFIFVEHAKQLPPDRIEFGLGQTITVEPDGPRTIVRLVSPGTLEGATWGDIYDGVEEGWRAFFHQLRHHLERHRGEERRTLYLSGSVPARDVLAGVDALAPGGPWLASRYQRITAVDAYGGGLVAVLGTRPLDADGADKITVTVTTHGLDDGAFDAVRRDWAAWWGGVAENPKVVP